MHKWRQLIDSKTPKSDTQWHHFPFILWSQCNCSLPSLWLFSSSFIACVVMLVLVSCDFGQSRMSQVGWWLAHIGGIILMNMGKATGCLNLERQPQVGRTVLEADSGIFAWAQCLCSAGGGFAFSARFSFKARWLALLITGAALQGAGLWLHPGQCGQQKEFNQHDYLGKQFFKTKHWTWSDFLEQEKAYVLC